VNGIGSQIAEETEYVSQCDNCSEILVIGLMNVAATPSKDTPVPQQLNSKSAARVRCCRRHR